MGRLDEDAQAQWQSVCPPPISVTRDALCTDELWTPDCRWPPVYRLQCQHQYGWIVFGEVDHRISKMCFDGDSEVDVLSRMHAIVRSQLSAEIADRMLGVRLDRHVPEDGPWTTSTHHSVTGLTVCWEWSARAATAKPPGR